MIIKVVNNNADDNFYIYKKKGKEKEIISTDFVT